MKLSKRLKTICDFIDNNSRVIDVGCDHAYLDIYLTLEKKCNCLAIDINKNALNNAISNIKKYNLDNKIEIKLTDGINDININNNDILVISGMGFNTIKNILINKKLPNTIIISSNNEVPNLRKFMHSVNYYIEDEKYIIDNKKEYIIIKFLKGKKNYKKIDYILGPILKNDKEYLKSMKIKYIKILNYIPKKYYFKRMYYNYIIYKIKKNF